MEKLRHEALSGLIRVRRHIKGKRQRLYFCIPYRPTWRGVLRGLPLRVGVSSPGLKITHTLACSILAAISPIPTCPGAFQNTGSTIQEQ